MSEKTVNDEELLPIQIDEEVALKFQFPQIEGEQVVLGKVKSIKRDKKQITLGIMFHEIKDIIIQYIKELPKSRLG